MSFIRAVLIFCFVMFSMGARAQVPGEPPVRSVWQYWSNPVINNLQIPRNRETELSLVAWNVGQSKYSRELQQALQANLDAILRSTGAPDILLLIEAGASTVEALKGIEFAKKGYKAASVPYDARNPWAYFIVLWREPSLGLLRISHFPMEGNLRDSTPEEAKAYTKEKEFIAGEVSNVMHLGMTEFSFRHARGGFTLYPAHFTNIWPALQKMYYPLAREGARNMWLPASVEEWNANVSSKAVLLKELLSGEKNPHFVQLKEFLAEIEFAHPQLHPATDDAVLVVGDFNAFPRIEGMYGKVARYTMGTDKSRACQEMEKTFQPLYASPGQNSFPTKSYLAASPASDQELLIDLGYFRGPLWQGGSAQVLPMVGSDHFPVYYKILFKP